MKAPVTYIITLATLFALFWFLNWAVQRGKPTGTPDAGMLLFRHNMVVRGFALVAVFGIPIALTILAIFSPPGPAELQWPVLWYALFSGIGLPAWWESTRFSLAVSSKGLDCVSPWRGRRFVPWEEVSEISYSAMSRWFIIRAKNGWKFRVYLIHGINQFLEQCEVHLEPESLANAKLGYKYVGRQFPEREV